MDRQLEKKDPARFVVLFHQLPADHEREDHWDLMLEKEFELATWALEQMPERGKSIPAVRLADHRKAYLDYQGDVSGDRGSVTRVMQGDYFWKPDSFGPQLVLNFEGGSMDVEFQGQGEGDGDGEQLLVIVR